MDKIFKNLSRKLAEMRKIIFTKVVDFLGAKYEIATEESISRQTVLGTGSRLRQSYLPVFRVLRTRSLDFAQLFPSAYFNERNPQMAYAVWGFFILLLPVNIFGYSPFVKLKLK